MAATIVSRRTEYVKNIIGNKYGRLTIASVIPRTAKGQQLRVACQCECGQVIETRYNALTTGNTRSCGCLYLETRGIGTMKHGAARKGAARMPEYRIWQMMIDRCENRDSRVFKDYGGRGIGVCDRWKNSFSDFLSDVGPRPIGATLEREDNEGNYDPRNVIWDTRAAQSRNTRRTIRITIGGRTQCMKDWCEELKIVQYRTASSRICRGMDPEKAVMTPSLKIGPGWKDGVRQMTQIFVDDK